MSMRWIYWGFAVVVVALIAGVVWAITGGRVNGASFVKEVALRGKIADIEAKAKRSEDRGKADAIKVEIENAKAEPDKRERLRKLAEIANGAVGKNG